MGALSVRSTPGWVPRVINNHAFEGMYYMIDRILLVSERHGVIGACSNHAWTAEEVEEVLYGSV